MLIIPVCGEFDDFLKLLMQHQHHKKVLLIVIVNRPINHPKSHQWFKENNALIQYMKRQYIEVGELSAGHLLLTKKYNLDCEHDVLLLNFNAQGFDPSKGVGLARRIAADSALSLIERNVIKTPWVFSTDADVVLPATYFDVIKGVKANTSALSLKFNHFAESSEQDKLQQQYDFKLEYYRLGVRFLGANYDYIPLGSTLVISADCYAKVRGFPCRSGGEDFYILNKLAKVGDIYQPQLPIINIRSRFSDRVPFGTGPAISKIQQQQLKGEVVTFYNPQIFHQLKLWRAALVFYYDANVLPKQDCGLNEYWDVETVLLKGVSQINTKQRWNQFIHEWFDAFRILKSVHFLRGTYKSIPFDELFGSSERNVENIFHQ